MPETTDEDAISSPVASVDSCDRAVPGRDRRDVGAAADLRAGRLRRCRKRIGQRARPAHGEHRLAGRSAVVAGRIAEEDRGRARRPRPDRAVLDPAPGDRRLDRIGLERLGDEVRDRHRQDPQDRMGIALAEAAERPTQLQARERITQAGRLDVGRGLAGDLAEKAP